MFPKNLDNFHLLLRCQTVNGHLDDASDRCMVTCDEASVVEKGNGPHDELAVHAIRDTTVSGNRITKVLDLEGTLETGSKETSKGGNQGCKSGEYVNVELNRHEVELAGNGQTSRDKGDRVVAGNENGVWLALKAGPDVCAEILLLVSKVDATLSDDSH